MSQAQPPHPGGVPAPTQPYDSVPRSGSVNFSRFVLQPENREQSEREDGVDPRENSLTPEHGAIGQEVEEVKGYKYVWASNICHKDDTKVQVEDFSDVNINPELEQKTHDLLRDALVCDGRDKPAYSRLQNGDNVITEEFTTPSPFGDLRVCRKTYPFIDVREKGVRQYTESPMAKRIGKTARDRAGPAPTRAQEEHVACRIYARNNRVLPNGAQREKWPILLAQAQKELYLHRNDATYQAALNNEMKGAKPADCTITDEDVELVKEKLPNKLNTYDRSLVDSEAANACERIEGFDIVICRDKNNRLMVGVFTEAIQKLLSGDILDKMARASKVVAYRLPILEADPLRHPTNEAIHLAKFPNKDVNSEKCEQPHFAVCGVEHMGAHHETGCNNGLRRLCFQDFSVKGHGVEPVLKSSAWTEEHRKHKDSVHGTTTKVSRVSLKAWDPELYDEVLGVREKLPGALQLTLATTGDNPYGYMAHLFDVQTEGHTDSTDWEGGLASLTCFGDFTGGDLVLPLLNLKIPFPRGSNSHLRGREMRHYVTGYEGTRFCIVLTNKESVRQTAPEFDKDHPDVMEKNDQYMEKVARMTVEEIADLSAYNKDVINANRKEESDVREVVWRWKKKEERDSRCKKDDSAQPRAKRQKTSKAE